MYSINYYCLISVLILLLRFSQHLKSIFKVVHLFKDKNELKMILFHLLILLTFISLPKKNFSIERIVVIYNEKTLLIVHFYSY